MRPVTIFKVETGKMVRYVNDMLWMLLLVLFLLSFRLHLGSAKAFAVKKSASSDDNMMDHAESSLDRLNINYDEYPVRIYIYIRSIGNVVYFYKNPELSYK